MKKAFFLISIFGYFNLLISGNQDNTRRIVWQSPKSQNINEKETIQYTSFEGAYYKDINSLLPNYYEKIRLKQSNNFEVLVTQMVFEAIPDEDFHILSKKFSFPYEIKIESHLLFEQKNPYAGVSIVPFRKNKETEKPERLISFSIIINEKSSIQKSTSGKKNRAIAINSVLDIGKWQRIGTSRDGIYKLRYKDLVKMGLDVSSINPSDIRIFGNGGGMLPFANSSPRRDDLTENSIYVHGEGDGKFDTTDYVLFYGQSPHRWKHTTPGSCSISSSEKRFQHITHEYSDSTYYFFTADNRSDLGSAKRIGTINSVSLPATHTVNSFDDYQHHEYDQVNLIKSGRTWLGEYFDIVTSYGFSFSFPNIDLSAPVWTKVEMAARNSVNSIFSANTPNGSFQVNVPSVDITCHYCPYASMGCNSFSFTPVSSSIGISISKTTPTSIGWLNYIEINARRNLVMYGEQMPFRDAASVGIGNISLFNFQSSAPISIWDITDPTDAERVNLLPGNYQFTLQTDSLREFIAFTGNLFYSPSFHGPVSNQNLHKYAGEHPDMVIVSHPLFMKEANSLADYHTDKDKLKVVVVTPQEIYNEFSSGSQDVSAIRDFMKMLYDNASTQEELPKYLLLFGDGSYDNKKRFSSNSNYIVSYQSSESFSYTSSYVSDDYFGLLDDSEGEWDVAPGIMDIGIGRLPVRTVSEAQSALNKIYKYTGTNVNFNSRQSCNQTECSSYGDWRNTVCFVADDEDQNLHFDQAQVIASYVESNYKKYNAAKIYFDSYVQQSTPGGSRYPDANSDFNRILEKGALIVNYTGHGGELGLSHERVLEISDINKWKNICNMPLFFTATCEFTRWDDPERISAGEYVFLNPNGGAIALMSTARLVFAGPNSELNKAFYRTVFEKNKGEIPRMGDVFRLTKAAMSGGDINHRNFTLIGDPAIRLAYPVGNIFTDSINYNPISTVAYDTLNALSKVTITGYIADKDSNFLTSYNGILYPTVFDKASLITLLSNDEPSNNSLKDPFNLQKNIIYKGKVGVRNGRFSFSFIVPKDISYQFGQGKISYYYVDSVAGIGDANGICQNIIIGGSSSIASSDVQGPEIKLYMNDEKFVFGGTTSEKPQLYAILSDSNGINVVGNGIGHDITYVLDGETKSSVNLNDYYEADINNYRSGKIRYPFSSLSEGRHTLKLKVWDVYNNSSDAYTEFVVSKSAQLALQHVINYPNPFTTRTRFFFEHNQCCDELNVQIQVFTISGKLVKTIGTSFYAEGYRAEPIEWDGKDDFGDKIGKGVYIYKVKVKNSDGKMAEKFEKLVILN